MAQAQWLGANGQPVATAPHTFQIELPTQPGVMVGAPDIFKVITAVLQLITALATGNPAAIIAAIQAFIAAIMGT
jgi:hypothetical protein